MKQYAVYNITDGSIVSVGTAPDDLLPKEGLLNGADGLHVYHAKSRPIDVENDRILNNTVVKKPSSVIDEQERKLAWQKVRGQRYALLIASDWTQTIDSPFDATARQEWADYRQALRDITDQTDDPALVVFPQPPT
jgi:hypothetical protein